MPSFLQQCRSWWERLLAIRSILSWLSSWNPAIMTLFISGYQLLLISEVCLRFWMVITVYGTHSIVGICTVILVCLLVYDLLRRMAKHWSYCLTTVSACCSQALYCWHRVQSTIVAATAHSVTSSWYYLLRRHLSIFNRHLRLQPWGLDKRIARATGAIRIILKQRMMAFLLLSVYTHMADIPRLDIR